MHVLVINCGSTSLKAALVEPKSGVCAAKAKVERIGEGARLTLNGEALEGTAETHSEALAAVLPRLIAGHTVAAVGHRVVHGGECFTAPTRITDEVLATIESLSPLAPLHNPANVAGIRAARELLPQLPQVAVFDTAFHSTLPRRARTYALPTELAARHGLRRYGFHGPSHQYIANLAATHLDSDLRDLRVITCHLGGGCSMAAIEYGASIETSMGLTPLEGLVMGTRSGDVDPGLLLTLARAEGLGLDELDTLLNRNSGLKGLAGSADLRDIEERAAAGDDAARLAIQVFAHRVRKYIGAYAAVLGGVDAIIFTGGIGQHSALMRHRIAQRLDFLGARLDEDRNRDAAVRFDAPIADISSGNSRCRLLVARTDEEHAIARATALLGLGADLIDRPDPIPVAVSARHVHLTQEHVEALFGEGYTLTPKRELGQPGQYACEERVTLVGPKRTIERVGIIGPTRPKTQIEISRTDEFTLGIDAPVRRSGDIENTPGITLIGTEDRRLTLDKGVICAWRHIHMTPEDAEQYGVTHMDLVDVEFDTENRDLIMKDVMVRVKSSYKLEMHIDTDEANAAGLPRFSEGMLIDTSKSVRLTRRSAKHDTLG